MLPLINSTFDDPAVISRTLGQRPSCHGANSKPQRLDKGRQGGWLLSPAGVIKKEARKRLTPVFEHANEPKELHIIDIPGNYHADRIFSVAGEEIEPILRTFLARYSLK